MIFEYQYSSLKETVVIKFIIFNIADEMYKSMQIIPLHESLYKTIPIPTDPRRNNSVTITSNRHHDVVLT